MLFRWIGKLTLNFPRYFLLLFWFMWKLNAPDRDAVLGQAICGVAYW